MIEYILDDEIFIICDGGIENNHITPLDMLRYADLSSGDYYVSEVIDSKAFKLDESKLIDPNERKFISVYTGACIGS